MNRFDIYNSTEEAGIQVGEDFEEPESIAFLIKLDMGEKPDYRFTVDYMDRGDQYEIYFSIGEGSFCILFTADGPSSGICTLFNKTDGWSSTVSLKVTNIVSGEIYNTTDFKIGFILTDASEKEWGYVKFIISKQYLFELGARGYLVTGIYATTRSSGEGNPGSGMMMDRCPAEGTAEWKLQGDIPDLPMGILFLAFPIIAIYAYLKRSRSGVAHSLKIRN